MTPAKTLPRLVSLRGVKFEVTEWEGMIVFREQNPIPGTPPTRFSFERLSGYWFLSVGGNGGQVFVSYVAEAYTLVCKAYGGNSEFDRPGANP